VIHVNTLEGLEGVDIGTKCATEATWVHKEIFLDRVYTPRGVRMWPGMTVVDVGGAMGLFAIFARKVMKAREIVVIEPAPESYELCVHNIEAALNLRVKSIDDVVALDGADHSVSVGVDIPDHVSGPGTSHGPGTSRGPGMSHSPDTPHGGRVCSDNGQTATRSQGMDTDFSCQKGVPHTSPDTNSKNSSNANNNNSESKITCYNCACTSQRGLSEMVYFPNLPSNSTMRAHEHAKRAHKLGK
jgi:hypothetical protein